MIEETAIVVDIKDGKLLLETQRQSACQSCSVKSACGTSTLAKVVGNRSSQFIVDKTFEVQVGDQVIVAIEENALVQGSLLIYLLPIIIMLGFGLFADLMFSNELFTIVMSATGLLISIFVVRTLLSISDFKRSIQPQLIRRIL